MGELHVVRQKEADVKMPHEMPLVVADGMRSAHWIVHRTAHEWVVFVQGLLTQVEQAKAFWYTSHVVIEDKRYANVSGHSKSFRPYQNFAYRRFS